MKFGKIIKKFKSRKGNEVVFRAPVPEDFQSMWQFACNLAAEDTFVELAGKPPTRQEERKWFDEVLRKVTKKEAIHMVIEVNNRFAGNAEIRIGKMRHKYTGNIGLSLAPGYRDEGIGTEILKTLMAEAKKFGLRLLTIHCFENNPRALHVYEKLGFKRVGTIPGAIAYRGKYVGEVVLYLPLIETKRV